MKDRRGREQKGSRAVRLNTEIYVTAHAYAGPGLTDAVAISTTVAAAAGHSLEQLTAAVNARQCAHAIRIGLMVADGQGLTARPMYSAGAFYLRVFSGDGTQTDIAVGRAARAAVERQLREWGIGLEQLTGRLSAEPLPTIEATELEETKID